MLNIIKDFLQWYKVDRHKIDHLKLMLRQDNQWMSHNRIARGLTDRYIIALSDQWHETAFKHSSELRGDLYCDPHDDVGLSIDAMKDLNINLANMLYEDLNEHQKRVFIRGIQVSYRLDNDQIASMLNVEKACLLALFIKDNAEL